MMQEQKQEEQEMVRQIPGGVCAAKGFEASAAQAGIKYEGRTDMALLYSKMPCTAAGTFTTNVVKAAPVVWDRTLVREKGQKVRAVVINSGIANACTGEEGMKVCNETAKEASLALHLAPEEVLIASTGVIGMPIPMDRIKKGIHLLADKKGHSREEGDLAAHAILTTDTHDKQVAVEFSLKGNDQKEVTCTIGGMAKGSGMIHPGMCTMLCFISTDVAISRDLLQKALSQAVDDSFNMISVDGDMSTNDTVLVLSNGYAGNDIINEENEEYQCFLAALSFVTRALAMEIAKDGEGATKLITSQVIHADTKEHARILAKSVIQSNLTKAALFGKDANWGRVLCALGYAGVDFDPENVDLYFEAGGKSMLIYAKGKGTDFSEKEAKELLSEDTVTILSDMHMGQEEATAWGCDLTYDYVKINADYRS